LRDFTKDDKDKIDTKLSVACIDKIAKLAELDKFVLDYPKANEIP
jgi:hypothetical protein